MSEKKRLRWAVFGAVGVVVAVLLVSLGFLIHGSVYSGRVVVRVAPSTAKVMVGNEELGTMGEYVVRPGEYEVVVSAEGFESKTGRLVVRDGTSATVALYLEPVAGNEGWYDEHPGEALIKGEILNAETLSRVEEIMAREPVLSKLPRTVEYFTEGYSDYVKYVITYEYDFGTPAGYRVVVKDYTGGNEGEAREWLAEQGATGEVRYEDLTGERL